MNLFQFGDFTLASGARSCFRIECDALTPADWDGLAAMAVPFLPPFRMVLGVPRGGTPFAQALDKYATTEGCGPVLIVDDVWTTGGSMRRFIKTMDVAHNCIGLVAFARNAPEPWVTALFQMPMVPHVVPHD